MDLTYSRKEKEMNWVILIFAFLFFARPVMAETLEERIKKLEETIQKQQEVLKEQQKGPGGIEGPIQTGEDRRAAAAPPAPPRDYRLDDKSRGIYVPSASPLTPYSLTKQSATPGLMNPAISLILDTEYYHSTLSKSELESRSTPGFHRSPGALLLTRDST